MKLLNIQISTRIIVVFCALLAVKLAGAADPDVESLRGISSLYVLVENLRHADELRGLTVQDIRRDVELRLRMAGIKVLTEEEMLSTMSPYLYVNVIVVPSRDRPGLVVFAISCELKQMVTVTRDSSITTMAATWDTGEAGLVGSDNTDRIRNHINDLVDEFINAYLSVNPKK